MTRIPLGGMGNGLERAYSENFFIINGYNIRKLIWFLLVLIQNETKILQSAKIEDYSQNERPIGGIRMARKSLLNSSFSYFRYTY